MPHPNSRAGGSGLPGAAPAPGPECPFCWMGWGRTQHRAAPVSCSHEYGQCLEQALPRRALLLLSRGLPDKGGPWDPGAGTAVCRGCWLPASRAACLQGDGESPCAWEQSLAMGADLSFPCAMGHCWGRAVCGVHPPPQGAAVLMGLGWFAAASGEPGNQFLFPLVSQQQHCQGSWLPTFQGNLAVRVLPSSLLALGVLGWWVSAGTCPCWRVSALPATAWGWESRAAPGERVLRRCRCAGSQGTAQEREGEEQHKTPSCPALPGLRQACRQQGPCGGKAQGEQ